MSAYFPSGQRWYTLTLSNSSAAGVSVTPFVDTVDGGTFKSLYTPLTSTNIHVSLFYPFLSIPIPPIAYLTNKY